MITAFYLTSGWLMGEKKLDTPIKDLAKKRVRSLGTPYLSFTLIILAFDFILMAFNYYDIKFILTEIYKTVTLRGIGTLWFLPAILFAEVGFDYVRKKNLYVLLATVLLVIVYMIIYSNTLEYRNSDIAKIIDAPFRTLNNAAQGFIVIAFSYYTSRWYQQNRNQLKLNDSKRFGIMILFLSIFFLSLFYPINSNVLFDFLSKYVLYYCLLFGMFIFSYFVGKSHFSSFFSYWGENSIVLMVTHYSIMLVICEIVNKHLFGNDQFSGYITLVFFAVTVILNYPIVYFINRNARFLLGK